MAFPRWSKGILNAAKRGGGGGQLVVSPTAGCIRARGVRVHNLKGVDVDIPRGALVAICGVSGSGKTSLALDTLYAEGQRRYIESFSAYTRQFLERITKPDFDGIEGLPPSLAVTRVRSVRGNRSTVGTASDVLDYLRVLMSHASYLICHQCQRPVHRWTTEEVAKWIGSGSPSWRMMLAFPIHWEDAGERASVLSDLQSDGFVRFVAGEHTVQLSDDRDRLVRCFPEAGMAWCVVDRLRGGADSSRLMDSIETAFERADEIAVFVDQPADVVARSPRGDADSAADSSEASRQEAGPWVEAMSIDEMPWSICRFSTVQRCLPCGIDYPDPHPPLFSFNHALGACPQCEGFGDTVEWDLDLIVPDKQRSLAAGAIACWNSPAYEPWLLELLDVADELGIRVDVPFEQLTDREKAILFHGDAGTGFSGLDGFFRYLESKKYKMHVRVFLSRWRSYRQCSACQGARLNPIALSFRLGGYSLAQLCDQKIERLIEIIEQLQLTPRQLAATHTAVEQLLSRLRYLQRVGLGYLQLSRPLRTLSGGEAQRTALTAALGSNLCHLLYVLDEPSVGLHPADVQQLVECVKELARRGNTVLVVEHEEDMVRSADTVIEVGPSAGRAGGEIVFAGSQSQFLKSSCLTAQFLTGRRAVPIPAQRRSPEGYLEISGCRGHNLQHLTVQIPLGVLCVVTGVSGSGKSTLVQDTLYPALANRLSDAQERPLPFDKLTGVGLIKECILVDQSPVSRSPRSNPVSYVKAFDPIRQVFASTWEAKSRNWTAGHFSFNSELGRCDHCRGDGVLQIDMQFLADIVMTCPTCGGTRYRSDVLQVKYRGQTIADVLEMSAEEAKDFFRGESKVQQRLQVLIDVGLGYLPLGQSATTLSAGEAQRLKLAGFLATASSKKTLFLLDEPTTGLHPHDIVRLLSCFDSLLQRGHSLLVVEHNVHLMAAADHLIDLGPGAAEEGGRIVAAGTPEYLATVPQSRTAPYLRSVLSQLSSA
ncbi:MAG: UvrABC system protein A [Pirellulaceae bacterium]|nr:MAG: UvrABC system protein A [Pirellulaceae bacterium]